MTVVDFPEKYQKACDTLYFKMGQCCTGCDHWRSDAGMIGACTKSPIISGEDVALSLGIRSSSKNFAPDHPHTRAEYTCGNFKDDFDWQSLPNHYLREIGYNGSK